MYRKILGVLAPLLRGVAPRADNRTTGPTMEASLSRFAVDLYRELRSEEGNVFFSPYSISAALAMAREGARGETAAELDRVLHFPPDLAKAQGVLAEALRPREVDAYDEHDVVRRMPAYELNVANALWGQEGLPFLAPFTQALEQHHGAPLRRIDFRRSDEARRRINAWVAEQTRERIQDIVPPGMPDPDTRLVSANAIYFKASWDEPFEESATRDAPFYAPKGEVSARLMRQTDHLEYAEDGAVQVLRLPYRGRDTSMLVVLPQRRDGLAAVEKKLTAEGLAGWLGGLKSTRVDVQLPRFHARHGFDAVRALSALGLSRAFSDTQADFSGMLREEPLCIGAVLHEAFVAVDEEGTEAAAATVTGTRAASARPQRPVRFVADHPFLFLIRHEATGAVLFMGRLSDPTRS
jgi:serpin B